MAQKFLVRQGGKTIQAEAADVSAGVADAGRVPALGSDGRLSPTMMPPGIGAETQLITATENLAAGSFVNIYSDVGDLAVRLADNSNGRAADGYIQTAVLMAQDALVYPLDGVNANLSGLTPGAEYWLGTAGAVTDTPLDENDVANANKISQYLGKAKSATELITTDDGYVVL